ncbi:MAG: TrmB family transcriptional regulator [Deltaproteobacteria bacterium]|nr:TrmB family transcriptional regulator [Deltaproteobacteria bacterium]
MTDPLETLQALGLNRLEAEIYSFLLRQPEPVTAYAVGKALGKATANVYKAVEALALKGAVTVQEGEPRLCQAASVEEFLAQLERQFRSHKQRASKELKELGPPQAQEGIYRLASVPLVLERASTMLARAQKIVILDAFPEALEAIQPAAEAAAARGVQILVLAYAPTQIDGPTVVHAPRGAHSLQFWRCQQLNLVVDAQEALLSLLTEGLERVHHALWTDDLYLSCLLHAGLNMERTIHQLDGLSSRVDLPAEIREILRHQGFFYNSDLPGQSLLFERYGMYPSGLLPEDGPA